MAEMTMRDLVMKHKRLQHDWSERFRATFGVPLSSYMDTFTGFDICRFDSEVVKSGDSQMAEAVRRNYGEDAVTLIQALIA